MSEGVTMSDEMAQYAEAIATAAGRENPEQSIANLLGLDAESPFAHASKSAQLGQQAKEASDATDSAIFRLNQVAYSSEITSSRQSSIIASNILEEAQSLIQANNSRLQGLIEAGEETSEFYKYEAPRMRQQVVDKVRSMIFEAANQAEDTTVRQLLDAMETQMSGRYRGVRRIMSQPGYLDENTLAMMFDARRTERGISFLSRQEGISDLADQYDPLAKRIATATVEEKASILEESRRVLEAFKADGVASGISLEEARVAAASLIDGSTTIESLGLDELNEKAVRQIRMLQQYRSTIEQLDMNEVLSFGNRPDARRYAPEAIELTADERASIFRGLDGASTMETTRAAGTTYKRIGKEFFDKPIVKKSAYATAGLIAASFIYSATKDRSESDISGPPLLPGGSAYEAMAQRQPQIPQGSIFSGYDEGVSYSVNIEGSREQAESFSNSIGSVARGPVNSTMYRGLSQLGRDPYSQIASSY